MKEGKIIISRDVIFEEESKWDWSNKEIVKGQDMATESEIREEEGPMEEETSSSEDEETRERRQTHQNFPNASSNSSGEDSSPPNRKTRSISELLLTAPYADIEYSAIVEGCFASSEEPSVFKEAVQYSEWREAMKEEIHMIEKNKTWSLVQRPTDKNVVSVKWIYRLKTDANGNVVRHKARLVARGFAQQYGVDYLETFAPVSRHETIRLLLAVAAQRKWKLFQLDVKSAFLNGELEEEIYIEQPLGFEEEGKEDHVLHLHKALYGLKQAPRAWYSKIDEFFRRENFKRSDNDHALYTKETDGKLLVVFIYVDDLIVTGDDENMVEEFKATMKAEFEMSDLAI